MKTLKTNYYVGVLLTASKNRDNKIQFFTKKGNGSVDLYARTNGFNSEPKVKHMEYIGSFPSMDSLLRTINDTRSEMYHRGLSVPGTKVFKLSK